MTGQAHRDPQLNDLCGDPDKRELLPAHGRYLLLSDIHLGDGGPTDLFGQSDQAFLELLESLAPTVDALILNGDVLDAPQSRRPLRIAAAHAPVLNQLAWWSQRKPLYYILGNHDLVSFQEGLLPDVRRCNSVALAGEALIFHGHQLDIHFHRGPLTGKGQRALRAHAAVEKLTGEFIRLPFAEHDSATNRFAHWLFYRLTMADRLWAQCWSSLGRPERLKRWAAHHDFWARSQWGDSHALLIPSLNALAQSRYRVLVTGHAHQAGILRRFEGCPSETVSGEPPVAWRQENRRTPHADQLQGRALANLGSWTFFESTYGIWQDNDLTLSDWKTQRPITDRAYRFSLTAQQIPGMQEWWQRYYGGFFRYRTPDVRRDRFPFRSESTGPLPS